MAAMLCEVRRMWHFDPELGKCMPLGLCPSEALLYKCFDLRHEKIFNQSHPNLVNSSSQAPRSSAAKD